jgi:hypothetical protein
VTVTKNSIFEKKKKSLFLTFSCPSKKREIMSTIVSVRDPSDHFQEIVSRIYLGSCDAFTKETITQKKITHVLSLGDFSNELDLPVQYKVR